MIERVSCLLIPLLLAGLAGSPAAAGDRSPDAAIAEGLACMRKGDFECALKSFLEAHDHSPSQRPIAEIGFAEQALGHWVDAELHLSAVLDHPDGWVNEHRKVIDDALKEVRTHLGTLQVSGSPEGSEVRIGDRAVSLLPLPKPIRLAVGSFKVSLRPSEPTYDPSETTVEIKAGRTTSVTLDCKKRAPVREAERAVADLVLPPMPSPASTPSTSKPIAEPSPDPVMPASPQISERSAWTTVAPWIGAAAGGFASASSFYVITRPGINQSPCSTGTFDRNCNAAVYTNAGTAVAAGVAASAGLVELLDRHVLNPDRPASEWRYYAASSLFLTAASLGASSGLNLGHDAYGDRTTRAVSWTSVGVAAVALVVGIGTLVTGE